MTYRTEIDGLRAVALLPVIFFHAGCDFFSGGFVGVDVFFVISGYLITTLILTEIESGEFSIINFYERRARRILPALFFVIVACMPFAWHWMLPTELKDFAQSSAAVSLFSSNLLFWLESGYFESAAELKPLLHTWSLAVEEQYYILFPIFILITWRFGKRFMTTLLAAIGLASIMLAQWGSAIHPNATFYLLPTRVWELTSGSLVAFYLLHESKTQAPEIFPSLPYHQVLSAAGLLLIAYAMIAYDGRTPFPGFFTLIPTVGTALIIVFASQATYVGRFLSNRVFVGIGLISYSAYLWHHPLFAFARVRSIHHPGNKTMLALGILSLALAYLTWRYIERPFRDKARFNRRDIFQAAAAVSAVVVSLGIIGHVNNGFEARTAANGKSFAELNLTERVRVNYGLSEVCDKAFTTSGQCRTDERPEILIWGDSFAMHLVQGILASRPDAKVIQMTKSVCGPIVGMAPINHKHSAAWADGCMDFNRSVVSWLKNNDSVRYAVLGSPFGQYVAEDWGIKTADRIEPADPRVALEYLEATLDVLSGMGIKPVIFAPPPSSDEDIGSCLAKSLMYGVAPAICNIEAIQYRHNRRQVIELLEEVAGRHRVIWFDDALCDGKTCSAELDGVFIYRDNGHLSHEGAVYLGKKMDFFRLITDVSIN